jgi:hypothetical protein
MPFAWRFWAALAFAGLCLGGWAWCAAVLRQAREALEKAALDNGDLRRRLRAEYADNRALRAELQQLRERGAA